MKPKRRTTSVWGTTLAAACPPLVLLAALALAACGGSDTATTETAAPSASVAATVSSTPTPTPTHTWTPGAKPIPAATFPPPDDATTDVGEASFGWTFKPTVDIQVTHLGYYDDGGNGLRHAHPVGIYDLARKKLLVRGMVQRDSPLEACYRFVKVAPVTLSAGRTYIVVTHAMPPFDPEVNFPKGLVWAAETGNRVQGEVDFFEDEEAKRLVFPTRESGFLFMTPNFKFRPTSASVAAATIPAQEGTTEGFQSSTNGWEFKPTVDIKVTDLGYFDDGGDGLRHPHPVGIFDTDTEKLLVKTTVQRMSPLDEAYRFAKIKPVTLQAGESYVVATVSYPPSILRSAAPLGWSGHPRSSTRATERRRPTSSCTRRRAATSSSPPTSSTVRSSPRRGRRNRRFEPSDLVARIAPDDRLREDVHMMAERLAAAERGDG